MKELIFKTDAKQIIDQLFDAGLFKDDVTRDQMILLEDLVHFLLSSKFDSYQRVEKLCKSIEKLDKENKVPNQ